MPELLLCLSANGPQYEDALALMLLERGQYRRGVMLYEQFVCNPGEPQSPERILGFDAGKCETALNGITPRVRHGDLVIRNTEDGHPLYGEPYQLALERLQSCVAARFKTASYGLIKPCRFPSSGKAPHAKAPYTAPVRDLDDAAESIIQDDAAVVVELYLAHVSAPDSATVSAGSMCERDQRRWVRHDLVRGLLLAGGQKPVYALVHPFYVGAVPGVSGRHLTLKDRRLVLQEARDMGLDGVGLWMHLGAGYTPIDEARKAMSVWPEESKGWGFGPMPKEVA